MENNSNKLVELVAKDGYLLMDKDRKSTFKRILCRQDKIDEFIELPETEALEAEENYKNSYKNENELEAVEV